MDDAVAARDVGLHHMRRLDLADAARAEAAALRHQRVLPVRPTLDQQHVAVARPDRHAVAPLHLAGHVPPVDHLRIDHRRPTHRVDIGTGLRAHQVVADIHRHPGDRAVIGREDGEGPAAMQQLGLAGTVQRLDEAAEPRVAGHHLQAVLGTGGAGAEQQPGGAEQQPGGGEEGEASHGGFLVWRGQKPRGPGEFAFDPPLPIVR